MKPPKYTVLQKPVGETPLEAIEKWKKANPAFAELSASYAGRLDPMASGDLLVLLGDECKRQKDYLGLDKEYEVEVLLDISSDTGDVLGLVTLANVNNIPSDADIRRAAQTLTGTHLLPYPLYSSKTVNGKPLFLYALEGKASEIEIPTHEETIYRIKYLDQKKLSARELKNRIDSMLALTPRSTEPSKELGADFRIKAIQECWNELLENLPEQEFHVLRFRVTCASGAYMRTLAGRMGSALGTSGLALSIHRTKIGRYMSLGRFGFWRRNFK